MLSLNYTSFTKHTKENICRFMKGKREVERAEMAKELLADYTQNKMGKLKHKEALEKLDKLPKDKFDIYESFELWTQAGQPDD